MTSRTLATIAILVAVIAAAVVAGLMKKCLADPEPEPATIAVLGLDTIPIYQISGVDTFEYPSILDASIISNYSVEDILFSINNKVKIDDYEFSRKQ